MDLAIMNTTATTEFELTDKPRSLKGAIDWVLRVTGKDGQDETGGGRSHIKELAKGIKGLLNNSNRDRNDNDVISPYREAFVGWLKLDEESGKGIIDALASGLAYFVGYDENGNVTGHGIGAVPTNNKNKPWSPRTGDTNKGYALTYSKDATWESTKVSTYISIFLEVIIVIILGLTHLYWQCRDGGEWRGKRLDGEGDKGDDLKEYLLGAGFPLVQLSTESTVPERLYTYLQGLDPKKYTTTKTHHTGNSIHSRLNSAFTELQEVSRDATSYDDLLKRLKSETEADTDFLKCIGSKDCQYKIDQLSVDKPNVEGLKNQAINLTSRDHPLTKLCRIAYAYLAATKADFKSTESGRTLSNALGGVVAVAGLGAAAYTAHVSGVISALAALVA
ncbi:variant erythrocyte surface antigen-1 family protein [Babesia caballi]|uniref:Variant erythrocyte surface antigen-1 family protein n=1 Tax=Babesia caballi TaxID=5871 RepID=A0AAV4LXT1_BABCB|nr:variant erythrocyte surface antigen-1 family protein [Babesia caballi]